MARDMKWNICLSVGRWRSFLMSVMGQIRVRTTLDKRLGLCLVSINNLNLETKAFAYKKLVQHLVLFSPCFV